MKLRSIYLYSAAGEGDSILMPGDRLGKSEALHAKQAAVHNAVADLLAFTLADGMRLTHFRDVGPVFRILVGTEESLRVLVDASHQEPDPPVQ